MIFVNSGGGHYWWMEVNHSFCVGESFALNLLHFLKHSTWNGLHVADLVFPWFLWIMGVCIPISIKSQIARNATKKDIISNIFVVSWSRMSGRRLEYLIILICGAALRQTVSNRTLFKHITRASCRRDSYHGSAAAVWHRVFCCSNHTCALLATNQCTAKREFSLACYVPCKLWLFVFHFQGKLKRALYDIYLLTFQWIAILCITCIHLALVFGLNVPGCPRFNDLHAR